MIIAAYYVRSVGKFGYIKTDKNALWPTALIAGSFALLYRYIPVKLASGCFACKRWKHILEESKYQRRWVCLSRLAISLAFLAGILGFEPFFVFLSILSVIASEHMCRVYAVFDELRTNWSDTDLVRLISPVEGSGTSSESPVEKGAIDFVTILLSIMSRFLPT
jgi:hypothetical protein